MKDWTRAILFGVGVLLFCGGWGIQQSAIQGRIASDEDDAGGKWFGDGKVVQVFIGEAPIERKFDIGTGVLALGGGLAAFAWRAPKR